MKLLFTSSTFSAQFKNLLGFVDADISFRRMKSSVQAATDEIVDIIGQTTYDTFFTGDDVNNSNPEFLDLVQYAVALNAYRIYAPTADVAVTNNGRKIRQDDHEVSAFKHQIDSNDEGLENLYYRHLDRLLKYMALNSKPINQKKYKHENLFVPSLSVFEDYFNIGASFFLYLNLLPGLRECENEEIISRIGKTLFDDKPALLLSDPELVELIQKACVFHALTWGIKRLNVKLFPAGIMQISEGGVKGGEGSTRGKASDNARTEAYQTFREDSFKYFIKIEKYIANKNNALLPQVNYFAKDYCDDDKFLDL